MAPPAAGPVPLAEFVTVVENSELLGQFTRYVLERALAVTARWAAEGLDVPVAVNMSPRSLLDTTLPSTASRASPVNGVLAADNPRANPTGAWSAWQTVSVTVALSAGTNTIGATATTRTVDPTSTE